MRQRGRSNNAPMIIERERRGAVPGWPRGLTMARELVARPVSSASGSRDSEMVVVAPCSSPEKVSSSVAGRELAVPLCLRNKRVTKRGEARP
jgi:hypothetical protein